MTDSLPPVAIRVARPYSTEEELLERELDTLTRTSVTLLGAQSRPQGVVLRFELVLSNGQVLMRGEGRVVGYKPDAYDGLGGLTLRFTRLDSRTKAVVDRAAALRDRRRPSTNTPALTEAGGDLAPIPSLIPSLMPSFAPSPPVPSIIPSFSPSVDSVGPSAAPHSDDSAPASLADVLEPPSTPLLESPEEATAREQSGMLPRGSAPRAADSELQLPPSDSDPPPVVAKSETKSEGPSDRDALLERLRVRSKSLGENALENLLGRRR